MAALTLLMVLIVASQAAAAPISIFATGVDNSGNAITIPASAKDPHYALVSSDDPSYPAPPPNIAHVLNNPPVGWVANNPTSQWISPPSTLGGETAPPGNPAGTYIYETTFDLGPNPTQVSINGDWSVGYIGLIMLNGVYVNFTTDTFGPTFTKSFSIPSSANFVSGANKLDFVIVTAGNTIPGLLVQDIRGSYTPGIPEPSTIVLAGLGGLAMIVVRWRRARSR